MRERFEKLLEDGGGYYAVDDILDLINAGAMQSFSDGHSWAITQVNEFPRKKVVDIVFVVGELESLTEILENKVEKFARSINADAITASGRPGWDKVKSEGWKRLSVNYSRSL